ncbi:hypothetical protein [Desulfobotulus sp.]|uniref:hypothetical protein n=1 Tax=Desulfobotulus sp. TaxID=1940337 RepID=UPI002A35FEC2|nr:hypothetical protein [Desulfobotulus sp.]MDY0164226.1 hypothetical protein [Desulfobotulus sp.]
MMSGARMPDVILIGDKLSDVARHLGILGRGMVTSQIPQIERIFPGIPQLECTRCIMGDKRRVLYTAAKRMGVNWIVLEKDGPDGPGWSGMNPASMEEELRQEGYRVDVVDFTQGLEKAVMDAGRIFEREKEGARLIKGYGEKMAGLAETMPRNLGLKVAVFLGMVHPETGQHYLVAEGPDTFCCQHLLRPMGCEEVGGSLVSGEGPEVLQSLLALKDVRPDVLVFTGDAQVGLGLLHGELAGDRALLEVPALRDLALFALPHVSGGEPMDYPARMQQWIMAFSPFKNR